MTDNNIQNGQAIKERESSNKTEAKLCEISDEKLKQILEDHKKWLDTDGKEGERANLQGTNLQGAFLHKANLQKAILKDANLQNDLLNGANLQKADLSGANLQKTDLSGANLQKAIMKDAKLQKANLSEANLQKAFLYKANLQKAILKKANLQKANLYKANLQKANFYRANLQKAILDRANLQKTLFSKANLQKTILDGTNLQKANLSHGNLQRAFLYRAYLQKANFLESNLQKANLIEANLSKANLYKAELQNTALNTVKGLNAANLQYANLEGATGLLGNEFAQADVTGAKLPNGIKEFKGLDIVEKTSQNARKIFFALLLGCVYSWLTIATTTDVRLLTNTASSPLPIIGTEIPIAGFYWAAPLVLICLFFYFHLYLDNLWEELAGLPAYFPDGKRIDQRAYPWLLVTLVRKHFKRLNERPLIAKIKEWITIFLAWWVVPITMIAFWLRYLPRHDWWGTIFHIGLIVVSVEFGIYFYRLCALTLEGKEKIDFNIQIFWKNRRFNHGVIVIFVLAIFSLASYGAIEGVRPPLLVDERKMNFYKITEVIPWIFERVGYSIFASFAEKSVSEKPDNYG